MFLQKNKFIMAVESNIMLKEKFKFFQKLFPMAIRPFVMQEQE